jgi:hypothetical protein
LLIVSSIIGIGFGLAAAFVHHKQGWRWSLALGVLFIAAVVAVDYASSLSDTEVGACLVAFGLTNVLWDRVAKEKGQHA